MTGRNSGAGTGRSYSGSECGEEVQVSVTAWPVANVAGPSEPFTFRVTKGAMVGVVGVVDVTAVPPLVEPLGGWMVPGMPFTTIVAHARVVPVDV
jgi:hypothetical protein